MTTNAALPVILVGGGGHARSVLAALLLAGRTVLGYTAPGSAPDLATGVGWIGDDERILDHVPSGVELVNGLGSTGDTSRRTSVFERLVERGYRFATVRHPAAVVSDLDTHLGAGVQLLAGSIVGPGAHVGDNVLLNTGAIVEHDCTVGSHCHVATGAILCGGCVLGEGVHVGAGASVIQGVTLGARAVIAAGAVVTGDVPAGKLVAGVPAKVKRDLHD